MSFILDKISSYIKPRKGAPPDIRKFLEQDGHRHIAQIRICRSPVQSFVKKFMNIISFGALERMMSKLGYDDLFHLYMFVDLDGISWTRFEKNEVVRLERRANPVGDQCINVPVTQIITIQKMFDNAVAANPDNFWLYDAKDNNCQVFIREMLKNSGLLTPEIEKFVMQDAISIFEGMPWFVHKVGKLATDIAATADTVIHGQGMYSDQKTALQAIVFSQQYFDVKSAKKWLKQHQLQPIKKVHKTKKSLRYRLADPDDFKGFITKKTSKGITFVIGIY